MSFRNLPLAIGYDSDETNILESFYKPVLEKAVHYRRLAGYFSSTTFALALREMIEFIKNNGKIQLVTSVELARQDKKIFEQIVNGNTDRFSHFLLEQIDESGSLFRDCASLMGWMLLNRVNGEPQLEIKIAIPETTNGQIDFSSIYHQKVGIFTDRNGDKVSFEGSINETGKAWFDNIEKFKVSVDWNDESDRKRVKIDEMTFEKFWSNNAKRTLVIDLPEAVKQKFLRIRPRSTQELGDLMLRIKNSLDVNKNTSLRDYQEEAIGNWAKNGYNGIFEMATGSGKTFTALGCIKKLLTSESRIIVIVSCPYTHIVEQWVKEFHVFNEKMENRWTVNGFVYERCYSEYSSWKIKLKNRIRNINEKKITGEYFLDKLIVFTTHNTLTSNNFIKIIREVTSPILLIVDEVHAIGSMLRLQNLQKSYNYRLGLSATPVRYFDDEGTMNLTKYFGGVVAKLTIGEAIRRKFLSPYQYIPYVVDLNCDEMAKYVELTKKIAKKLAVLNDPRTEGSEISSFVEGERANIIAAAEKKYDAFKNILNHLGSLDHCLIYCHEKQLERVNQILFERGIVYHQITYREPTDLRLKILEGLTEGTYDAVVAINCLDEGIDIPSAKVGIILASTGNPRQYIQRRGRLLRRELGKEQAIIYDILVVPHLNQQSDHITVLERKIVQRELERYSDFAGSANNKEEADKIIKKIKNIYSL